MAKRKALNPAHSRKKSGTTVVRRRKSRGGYEVAGFAERSRVMRKEPTTAEAVLWESLRDRRLCNAKFRRQHQFHNYICDFYCDKAKLVVECDGSSHDTADRIKRDTRRDAVLRAHGLTILRFRNARILDNLKAVLKAIAAHLSAR
jgi:very-short-patch-repair endonuclease